MMFIASDNHAETTATTTTTETEEILQQKVPK
jgi:hypothetical protein